MIRQLQITVLVENTARKAKLLAEHGLSFWIEVNGRRILFDTGQGLVLRHNARQLEIPLDATEIIALSHGHYDHTGGLGDVYSPSAREKIDLYLHPAALEEKYAQEKTPPHRYIGMAGIDELGLRRQTSHVIWTAEPTPLMEGVYLTGEIPRRNDFEDTGGPFYLDLACTEPDPIKDDQALYIETPAGIVVVLGCAHAGLVNTLDYIAELTGRDRMYAVFGGMHLVRAQRPRLEATIAALKRYHVQRIGTAHCTGMLATTYLWSRLPNECFECPVGTVLDFSPVF